MKIYIDRQYVIVEVIGHLWCFDCRKSIEDIKTQMDGNYFDCFDYQRIMKFILQNRRTIGVSR